MPEIKRRCETCEFVRRQGEVHYTTHYDEHERLLCFRFPPTHARKPITLAVHPKVQSWDWCYEWKEKTKC